MLATPRYRRISPTPARRSTFPRHSLNLPFPNAPSLPTSAALLIGAITAPICFFAARFLKRVRVDDRLECLPIHGVAGAVGTLLTGIFASKNEMSASDGAAYGNPGQFGKQLAAVLVTIAVCVVGTSLSFFITRLIGDFLGLPVRVSAEHEMDIDKSVVSDANAGARSTARSHRLLRHSCSTCISRYPLTSLLVIALLLFPRSLSTAARRARLRAPLSIPPPVRGRRPPPARGGLRQRRGRGVHQVPQRELVRPAGVAHGAPGGGGVEPHRRVRDAAACTRARALASVGPLALWRTVHISTRVRVSSVDGSYAANSKAPQIEK